MVAELNILEKSSLLLDDKLTELEVGLSLDFNNSESIAQWPTSPMSPSFLCSVHERNTPCRPSDARKNVISDIQN